MEAFLEVARHGTVKAAASELGLSMPALSRRIQTLEHAVGRPLFNRHHHGLKLTESGRELQDQLSPILDDLRSVLGRVGSPDASLRLHLNVLPLFAQQRLFPRLPELRQAHPELHIDIDTMSHAEARLGEGIDVAIAFIMLKHGFHAPEAAAGEHGRLQVRLRGGRGWAGKHDRSRSEFSEMLHHRLRQAARNLSASPFMQ